MIRIQFRRLSIFASEDRRTFEFVPGLNVVSGPYGSGKTSLLELLKYAIGGSAKLSEAVQSGVSSVVVEASLAGSTFSFERDIGGNRIKVSQGGEPVTVLHPTSPKAKGAELASAFLLRAVGAPAMRVRRTRKATSKATETISFWDMYRFAYVSQNDMGQSIAGHDESNLDRKRRRAFELMFGLLGARLAELELDESELAERLAGARRRLEDVTTFLESSGVPSRSQALVSLEQVNQARQEASDRLDALRSSARSTSLNLDPDRDALGGMHARHAALLGAKVTLEGEIASRRTLAAQLALEVERLKRTDVSAGVLASIDFRQCPRCLQSVDAGRADPSHCYLCLQELPGQSVDGSYEEEVERLEATLQEVSELQDEDEQALTLVTRDLDAVELEVRAAERDLRARADAYVAPLFEEIAELSAQVARSDGEERRVQMILAQWDERARIQKAAEGIDAEIRQVRRDVESERTRLEGHRAFVQELSDTFDEIVAELELAWYTRASVDLQSYLPVVNDAAFDTLSGGQRTVVSVAYHLALLTVGLVHPNDLLVPSLLILDTPSKYLGTKDAAQVARDYRRIAAIVDAYETPIQIIVADNDSPPSGVRVSQTIELSYTDPLVPGLEHPGEGVASIHDPYDESDES